VVEKLVRQEGMQVYVEPNLKRTMPNQVISASGLTFIAFVTLVIAFAFRLLLFLLITAFFSLGFAFVSLGFAFVSLDLPHVIRIRSPCATKMPPPNATKFRTPFLGPFLDIFPSTCRAK
jgi:hypothetical protein